MLRSHKIVKRKLRNLHCALARKHKSRQKIRGWGAKRVVKEHSREAKFQIGQVVKHRLFSFRGVIFDVDPVFANTEEWWLSIPEEIRPKKDQPFYHLFAENEETEYVAYVSEQNLLPEDNCEPVRHPQVGDYFDRFDKKLGAYRLRPQRAN
jgi:heat shock protein HspQ